MTQAQVADERRHADPSVQPTPLRGPLKVGIVSPYGTRTPAG